MKTTPLAAASIALALAAPALVAPLSAQETPTMVAGLARSAELGFRTSAADGALQVRDLESGAAAAAAGLEDDDVIARINGRKFRRPYEGQALLGALDAGVEIHLTIERNGEKREVSFTAPPRPLEEIPGVTSIYGAVETPDGARLRTIIARPEGAEGPLNPLLFTQWVSCGSIEHREGSGAREILAKVARESGLSVVRVERSSDGDSEGPACHELDYDTEIAHYIHAFKQLLSNENIDASKVYVNGSSLGSTTAPLVAHALQDAGFDIAGVAIQGGGAETYYERMLTFDRQYLERRPDKFDPADIHDELIARAKFHYEYLINDRDPDDIAKDSAAMAAVRADIRGLGDGEQYGRPYAWHQQAAKHNFLAAWDALAAPALVIFNEFDQFEAEYGHKVIADMMNRKRPGSATYVVQANVGHSNYRYETIEDAYANRDGQAVWETTADVIVEWLEDIRAEER